ncbi:MAG: hypothetical protein WKF73_10550 [Nocardioidaceae bacterium]
MEESDGLNCAEPDTIPAGGSVQFARRLGIPETAKGDDLLTWTLNGYAAVKSAPLIIE